ncbi:ATP synthase F1 subunit delta [candidate division WOR-1 bacterium RIFCSPHIGHO2_01_FULL_53_15]|uniref:ATP synthase subunit delta n=1 Tax=candidate division WOR-1 bacterium RIFCSPHIGHO2_01_FULL_53_15 TaxID=1802564 RepID=A0A1F4Q1C6_UNCSA|nr:MAG: ATP synthase F1 subunit delta [candidate division WOR-1 bacterium RIFCSPHIGHO2_01_FULL_53_15]OGC12809.1 MAG: ATP synthase F1 subunit delta [candidate division WOR-1 bacterium RIFCSPHIGHO2_02_FULL_53_26]
MKEIDLEKLYEIAGKEALTIESELNSLAKLLVKNFELRTFFENATFSKEAKTKLLAEVMPGVSVLFRNLIGLLIDENMEKAAIKLSERFTQLAARKTGTVFAEVAAAAALSEGEKKKIVDWLGGQVNLREEIDPDLIGGVKIFTSDGKYFDGTLSGALENLKESIINA